MEETQKGLLSYSYKMESSRQRQSIHSMSPIIGIIFVCSLFGLYGVIYLIDDILPKPLYISDEVNILYQK